jgi:hypothetical protein
MSRVSRTLWEDRQSRQEYDRERAREEGLQEERRNQNAWARQNSQDDNRNTQADCNIKWDHCARYCNAIADHNHRAVCVGNCNSELQLCN